MRFRCDLAVSAAAPAVKVPADRDSHLPDEGDGSRGAAQACRMAPTLRLEAPVPEVLLRVPEHKALDGRTSFGKQSFPGIHSQAEIRGRYGTGRRTSFPGLCS
jgi:hypothetical protein